MTTTSRSTACLWLACIEEAIVFALWFRWRRIKKNFETKFANCIWRCCDSSSSNRCAQDCGALRLGMCRSECCVLSPILKWRCYLRFCFVFFVFSLLFFVQTENTKQMQAMMTRMQELFQENRTLREENARLKSVY